MAAAVTAPAKPSMPYQVLGRSGLLVSRLSLGSWVTFHNQVDSSLAYDLMAAAYAAGVNFFDNAEAYAKGESERVMGRAIATGVAKGTWTREDLVISTKIYFGTAEGVNNKGLSRKHLVEGTRSALKRMELDYVDLLFCHRSDPVTPIEETVRAMNFLIDQGLTFYWGTSEWSVTDIAQACLIADRLGLIRPLMEQPQYNIFCRQRVEVEYATLYRDYGLGLTIWSPLASGILTGKYSGKVIPEGSRMSLPSYNFLVKVKIEGEDAWQIDAADTLIPLAEELGCTRSQLAIAWTLANPKVSTVILGATSMAQLEENLAALQVLPRLTPAVLARLDAMSGPAAPKASKGDAFVASYRGLDTLGGVDTGRIPRA